MHMADVDPSDTNAALAYYKESRQNGTWTADKAEALLTRSTDPQALMLGMAEIDKTLQDAEPAARQQMCQQISQGARSVGEIANALQTRLDDDQSEMSDRLSMVIQHLRRADQIIEDVALGLSTGPGAQEEQGTAPQEAISNASPVEPSAAEEGESDSTGPHEMVLVLVDLVKKATRISDVLQKGTLNESAAQPAVQHAATQVPKLLAQVEALLGTLVAAGHEQEEDGGPSSTQQGGDRSALAAALAKRRPPPGA